MRSELNIKKGIPYPLGATVMKNGINFAAVLYERKECGLILYKKKNPEKVVRIPFEETYFAGNICCVFVENILPDQWLYQFYREDTCFIDPYAKEVYGMEKFGMPVGQPEQLLRAGIPSSEFDWQGDEPLRIPYEDSVFYCLHVRGFTKNKKSGIRHKGTFLGVVEKIPYLKELGIKNLELQPVYEFSEWEEEQNTMQYAIEHFRDKPAETGTKDGVVRKGRINYWGYKNACFMAPKASYASGYAVEEFKTLVRECHKNGIEVILQFYFPDECKQGYILEVLKYWVLTYHIDGFHLMGERIPLTLLATEPLFGNTKLICSDFPYEEIYYGSEVPGYRNLASANDRFMIDMRRYLKGDENLLEQIKWHISMQDARHGNLHYITNYYGFTLADLVSYERKHNEENGEENRDGNDFNYSWNCGVEGPTKKASILKLRRKQMKNAMVFVILSQGTPFLTAGDEDCNSQSGNNNPYCQDNETGWKNWTNSRQGREQYAFVRELLRFRESHAVFHKTERMVSPESSSCPYPEVSFHSEEAFSLNTANYNRHMAVMYAGAYGDRNGNSDRNIYIAYNMHWVSHRFALPKLEKGYGWKLVMDTDEDDSFSVSEWKEDFTLVQGRSIQILISEKLCGERKQGGKNETMG